MKVKEEFEVKGDNVKEAGDRDCRCRENER